MLFFKKKYKKEKVYVEIHSSLSQLLNYFEKSKRENISLSYDYLVDFEDFSIFELIELDKNDEYKAEIDEFLKLIRKSRINTNSNILFDKLFLNSKLTLSTFHYILRLIAIRQKILDTNIRNIDLKEVVVKLLDFINTEIAQRRDMLREDLNDQFSFIDSFGYFLLYTKSSALRRFKNYLAANYHNNYTQYAIKFITSTEMVFERIELDFLPLIEFEELDLNSKFINLDNRYISREELLTIVNNRDVFAKEAPLFRLKQTELINPKKDYIKDEIIIQKIFRDLFFFLTIKKKFYDQDKMHIYFLNNLTQKYSDDDSLHWNNVKSYLLEILVDKNKEYVFAAVFYYLNKKAYIKNISKKGPKILREYFGESMNSKDTWESYITKLEPYNASYVVIRDRICEILDWRIIKRQKLVTPSN